MNDADHENILKNLEGRRHTTLSVAAAEEQALLDNFAMAALTGLVCAGLDRALLAGDARQVYDYAEACMTERKRRMEARQA